jgi:hypothetical protein
MRTPIVDFAKLRVVRFQGQSLVSGVATVQVEGVPTRITDPVRTVVDCFRLSRLIDRETALEALREVLRRPNVAPSQLLRVADALGGAGAIRSALEILGA